MCGSGIIDVQSQNNKMETTANLYDIALSFLAGVKDVNIKRLISKFGTAEKIFSAKKSDFVKTQGIGEYTAVKLIGSMSEALVRAEKEIRYLAANEVEVVTYFDKEYPQRLKECDDAPVVLYYKGKPGFNVSKVISIVGTRRASKYGTEFCKELISELAKKYPDIVIVSGLAYGVDIAAHKEAIDNDLETWAVLGHSLETIYPAKHKNIAMKIAGGKGALVSDYPHGSMTDASNFIKRNRIVAGLCDALVIVESGNKGGAMVTANIANHYNKDVFAVPGNLKAPYSVGCNNLIKTNRAHLIQSVEDIEYIMNWSSATTEISDKEKAITEKINKLSENEKIIVEILKKYDFLDIDNLMRQSKFDANTLSLLLLELEFKNIVRAMPGKLFSLRN